MKKNEQWQWCNVVRSGEVERKLWQFRPRGDGCALTREHAAVGSEKLPPKVATKDYQSLFQKKLNVAWLPPGDVFLSVVELPATDAAELQGMLELQLEKLSPLPVAQTTWTYVPLPRREGALTRVLLVVAARHAVEALLGRLEAEGFLADRLELPQIDELLAILNQGDGVWIFPQRTKDRFFALTAWLAGGELRHVGLTFLPENGWHEVVKSQFAQVVWSGELDGWLPGEVEANIVADRELAAEFEPVLRDCSGRPVRLHEPQSEQTLAQQTARRANTPQPVPLLPVEFSRRYRQLFVDRIWMRSLGAVVLVYLIVILGYLAAIEWAKHQQVTVRDTYRTVAQTYTNTTQLAQRVKILQNQMNLKYAALDSFKAVAEKLPEGVTINSFNFQRGGKVTLFGSAPSTDPSKITALAAALQAVQSNGRPLFASISAPDVRTEAGGGPTAGGLRWNLDCLLANPERER